MENDSTTKKYSRLAIIGPRFERLGGPPGFSPGSNSVLRIRGNLRQGHRPPGGTQAGQPKIPSRAPAYGIELRGLRGGHRASQPPSVRPGREGTRQRKACTNPPEQRPGPRRYGHGGTALPVSDP